MISIKLIKIQSFGDNNFEWKGKTQLRTLHLQYK
jgi:hypothetical protein